MNAETPRTAIAVLKIQPMVVSFQSVGADLSMPMRVERGRLNGEGGWRDAPAAETGGGYRMFAVQEHGLRD